jgi:hypothetical protein
MNWRLYILDFHAVMIDFNLFYIYKVCKFARFCIKINNEKY